MFPLPQLPAVVVFLGIMGTAHATIPSAEAGVAVVTANKASVAMEMTVPADFVGTRTAPLVVTESGEYHIELLPSAMTQASAQLDIEVLRMDVKPHELMASYESSGWEGQGLLLMHTQLEPGTYYISVKARGVGELLPANASMRSAPEAKPIPKGLPAPVSLRATRVGGA